VLTSAPRPYAVARSGSRALTVDLPIFGAESYDAYLFEKGASGWSERRFQLDPYYAPWDEMVSLTSTHAFIGSPEASSGEVLVYDLRTLTASEPVASEATGLALTVAPNPIRRDATVRFVLPEAGSARLVVYDVLGREVLRLADAPTLAGSHTARLDAGGLAAGSYFVRIETESDARTQLVTVVR
jgi:hypothetical protein